MKKHIITALCIILALSCAGCGNNTKEKKENTAAGQAKETPGLKGDTSVPKTGKEIKVQTEKECKTLDAACKKSGINLSIPSHIEGFGSGEKYISGTDFVKAVYFNKEGNTISITKGKKSVGRIDGYDNLYEKNIDDTTVSAGSRYDKQRVGKAVWEQDGSYYAIELSPWEEISWKEAKIIIQEII